MNTRILTIGQLLAFFAVAALSPAKAEPETATQPRYFGSMHELMVTAIKEGVAVGLLGGKLAEQFVQRFNGPPYLLARAEVVSSYERKGCKRLKATYTKEGTNEKGVPGRFTITTGLNYCADGSVPNNLGGTVK